MLDPRERRLVCKLDRCQLEDKYLRLLEEASKLKKLSNCQEDKIKRLATKLMRVAANPRACVSLDCNDKNKITALEVENSKVNKNNSKIKRKYACVDIGPFLLRFILCSIKKKKKMKKESKKKI